MLTAAIGCLPDLQLSAQQLAQHLTGSCRLSAILPAAVGYAADETLDAGLAVHGHVHQLPHATNQRWNMF